MIHSELLFCFLFLLIIHITISTLIYVNGKRRGCQGKMFDSDTNVYAFEVPVPLNSDTLALYFFSSSFCTAMAESSLSLVFLQNSFLLFSAHRHLIIDLSNRLHSLTVSLSQLDLCCLLHCPCLAHCLCTLNERECDGVKGLVS